MAKTETEDMSTALTVLQETYPALAVAGSGGANNLAPGEEVTPFDLDRIRVPGAGGLAWEINGEPVREFEAIVLHQRLIRTYWKESFDATGGSAAPDCSSPDAMRGTGDPGGNCKTCPMAQWGSAENGNGQACRLIRAMFLALPGREMPAVLMVPPSSVKTTKQYLLSLSGRRVPYQGVLTAFGLEKAQSGSGIAYSQVKPRIVRVLEPEELGQVRATINSMMEMFATDISVDVSRYDVEAESACEHPDESLRYTPNGVLMCSSCGQRWSEAQAAEVMAGR